jgi:hypothetical protein
MDWRITLLPLLLPAFAFGQSTPVIPPAGGDVTPPPIIEASPSDAPTGAPTPPPPGSVVAPAPTPYPQPPPPYGAVPPGMYPGYGSPYGLPYGQQTRLPPPGPEVGLMVTETLFGALTAAGISLLPYFLILQPSSTCNAPPGYSCSTVYIDPTVQTVLTIVIFGAVPLAVAETQLGIANGSRYYVSETWPAMLTGLGMEAAVLGLSYWVNQSNPSAAEWILLAGTVGVVPIVTMTVINLTKQPRFRMTLGPTGALFNYSPEAGFLASLPMPEPLLRPGVAVRGSAFSGVGIPLVRGVW